MKTPIQNLFLALALLAGIHQAAAQVTFTLASSPGVGSGPVSVTAADVNGDGRMDLISANLNANTLSVLTNNGSGGFVLSSSPGVGGGTHSVTAADVNGDGKVDLISANSGVDNTLSVLTNNGSGGFVLASSPGMGLTPISVVAADVNGDGKMDLISANYSASTLTVVTNNGSGGFVLSSSPGVGSPSYSVAAADVNGDGKMDLICANNTANMLTVLTNNGSGGFVIASSPGVGSGPGSVTAADVNGDGKVDLINTDYYDNKLTVLTNNGSGSFVIASSPSVGINPYSVTAADVNGDGKLDLICANYGDNTLTVLTNNGSGGFMLASSPSVGSGPNSVVAADVNGDGKMDLISANFNNNTLSVLINNTVFPPPIITVPANILVEATSASGAVVNFSTSATNLAGETVTTTNTPASGSTFALGTNTVTVTATSAGSSATNTFLVIVRDTTPPVINLLGANPLTNFINTPFIDPGATASDIYAGDLTGAIVVSGTVNTNVIGSYTLTYTVNDGGNSATTNRTVIVIDVPPSALLYSSNPATYTMGMPTSVNSPSSSGGSVVSYSVSPPLPAGLFLNTTTGVIFGTPTALAATANYTVTAVNTGGSTSVSLSITVNDVPPSSLSYQFNPATYTKDTPIIANSPSSSGGAVVSYSVSPPLPAGLALNTTTGVILVRTPTAVTATASYTVTAVNTGGSTSTILSITVNDVAPTSLTYSTNPAIYTKGTVISANSPGTSGGPVVSYSVSPLPAGLSFSTATGVISGTPTAVAATANYTVTAVNTGGSTSVSLSITVNDVAPSVNIASTGNQAVLFWPASATNVVLQTTTNLASPNWVTVTNGTPIIGVTVTNNLPAAFFRLQSQ